MGTRMAYRTCPLCEAGCGLEITLTDDRVDTNPRRSGRRVQPRVHLPKGIDAQAAPRGSRSSCAARSSAATASSSRPRGTRRSPRSSAGWRRSSRPTGVTQSPSYLGNPNAHSLAAMLYVKALVKAIGSRNVYTASTVDQRPKELSAALMFGGGLIVPVPDIDRTDFLLMLGANPYASNGSLATAPDWPGRIEALRARGGKLVVVDPRRSRTAEEADEWIAVRPGSDPFLLAAMVRVLLDEDLVDLGDVAAVRRGPGSSRSGVGSVRSRRRRRCHRRRRGDDPPPRPRAGRRAAGRGLRADRHDDRRVRDGRQLARRRAQHLHRQPRSPRRGDVHHAGGRRDEHAAARPVSGVACVPTTRGRGYATSPARSASCPPCASPRRSRRLGRVRSGRWCASPATRCCRCPTADASTPPWRSLDLVVSVDIYRNETSRHADVILPAPSALEKPHYDVALLQLGSAQRRQLVGAGAAAARRPARRVGGPRPPRPHRPGSGRAQAARVRSRPGDRRRPRDRLTGRRRRRRRARTPARPRRRRSARRPRAANRPGADRRLLPAQRPVRRPLRQRPDAGSPSTP